MPPRTQRSTTRFSRGRCITRIRGRRRIPPPRLRWRARTDKSWTAKTHKSGLIPRWTGRRSRYTNYMATRRHHQARSQSTTNCRARPWRRPMTNTPLWAPCPRVVGETTGRQWSRLWIATAGKMIDGRRRRISYLLRHPFNIQHDFNTGKNMVMLQTLFASRVM